MINPANGRTISHLNPDGRRVDVLIDYTNPAKIDPSAYIGWGCILGAGVVIGEHIHLGDWVFLGEGARLLTQYDHVILYEMGSRRAPCAVYFDPDHGIVISTGCQRGIDPDIFFQMVHDRYFSTNWLHYNAYTTQVRAAVGSVRDYMTSINAKLLELYQ